MYWWTVRPMQLLGSAPSPFVVVGVGIASWSPFVVVGVGVASLLSSLVRLRSALVFSVTGVAFGEGLGGGW